MDTLLPYEQWPDDLYQRKYLAENALGQALVKNLGYQRQFIKKKFAALVPALTEIELNALVTEAEFSGIYALLMVLDGVAGTEIDTKHGIEWELSARVLKWGVLPNPNSAEVPLDLGGSVTLSSFRPAGTERVETVNLAPDGDGLCYASHDWKEDYVNHNKS